MLFILVIRQNDVKVIVVQDKKPFKKRKKANKVQREKRRMIHAETFKYGFDTGYEAGHKVGYIEAMRELENRSG